MPSDHGSGNDRRAAAEHGGLAQYFVEHRGVAWLFFVALLVWGGIAFTRLPQQEDPKIPIRQAQVITAFPGATAAKVEQLVTKKIEKKISENETVSEIASESRSGVSIITVELEPAGQLRLDAEWDKIRAALAEVPLPKGCGEPFLDTNFGNTTTLLYAITSPPKSMWRSYWLRPCRSQHCDRRP